MNYGRYKDVVETKNNELRIIVSPAKVGKALRFFNAFIKLFRARNHYIILEYGNTYALIYDGKFEIRIKEKFTRFTSDDDNSVELFPVINTWVTSSYLYYFSIKKTQLVVLKKGSSLVINYC